MWINQHKLHTPKQTWFATLMLIAALLVSFGVVALDNHHSLTKEVITEASDVGEELEPFADDLPIRYALPSVTRLDHAPNHYTHDLVVVYDNSHQYVLSPRAPPLSS